MRHHLHILQRNPLLQYHQILHYNLSCSKISKTVPSARAANTPKAGSSPDKNPEANATALPPPSPDNGAVKAAIAAAPVGATPQCNPLQAPQHIQRMNRKTSLKLKQNLH